VSLRAGASTEVSVTADPRLLARFDEASGQWRIRKGTYRIVLARSATDHVAGVTVQLESRQFGR